MKKTYIWIIIILWMQSGFIFGQKNRDPDNSPPANNRIKVRQQIADEAARARRRHRNVYLLPSGGYPPSPSQRRSSRRTYIPLSQSEALLVTPETRYFTRYENFLRSHRKSGLIKILMESNCGSGSVLFVDKTKCSNSLSVAGGGAYFSFNTRYFGAKRWSDIHYVNGGIEVGFEESFLGLISNLGDVQIERINSGSAQIKQLRKYPIPKTQKALAERKVRAKHGIKIGIRNYSNNLPVKVNNTYAIRSIGYESKSFTRLYKLKDITAVFRVVKTDDNKAITIVWRRLKRKNSPYLKK